MITAYFQDYVAGYRPYKGGRWCYEDGCVYRGLECLHRATGERRWLDHLVRLARVQVCDDGALAGYAPADYNIDNILAGRALLYLAETEGDPRWMASAGALIEQLATHPRTRSGVYWHKLHYPWQVWLDGLYMGLPFQIGYGFASGRDELIEDALRQMSTALDMTYDVRTGLYAHAIDEARQQLWADPVTGQSQAHWARSLGWLAMALVDIAGLVGPIRFDPLRGRTIDLLSRIAALRGPDGLWLQVIDRPALDSNFGETSASAMFAYALASARNLDLWLGGPSSEIFSRLAASAIVDRGAGPEMVGICEVAGLGRFSGRERDGSPAYYLSEPCVSDDAKGVGPMMMAYSASLGRQQLYP